jgi:O-antigen/teichoic acid export membrane protein
MMGNAVSILVQFFGVIFIARVLGATGFGILSMASIPTSLAAILLNNGINSALVKYLSHNKLDDKSQCHRILIETGVILNFSVGLILTLITYFSSSFLAETIFSQQELVPLIKLYSFILIGQTLVNTANSVFVGSERMDLRSIMEILSNLLRSITGPALVYFGWGVLGVVSGNVASQILTGLFGFILVGTLWRSEPESIDFTHLECAKLMLVYSYPLFISNLLTGVNSNVTNFLLAMYVTPDYIGNYQAAARFSVLVTFFTVPLATVMIPLFSKLEQQANALRMTFVNGVKYSGLIIYPILAIVIALAPELVTMLYGQGYLYTTNYMRLYMLTFSLIGLGSISTGSLIIIKKTQIIFHQSLINFIVSIPLGVILIPRFGVNGFIITGISGSLLSFTYGLNWIKNNLGIEPDYGSAFKTILAATLAGLVSRVYLSLIPLNLGVGLFTGGVLYILIYIVLILLLKLIKREDLDNLEAISREWGPLYHVIKKIMALLQPLLIH